MGVRFFCPNCRCVLLIARRKAGTEIQCPKCSLRQTVPAQSDPLAVAARPAGSGPGEPGKGPVDAEGLILHWIEGDDLSVDDVRALDGVTHVGHPQASHPVEKTLPAWAPIAPPAPASAPSASPRARVELSAPEQVSFEEVAPAAPPIVRPADRVPPVSAAAPPIVQAESAPASRIWLVLLTLLVFAAAVAGAFAAGYMLGRQSVPVPVRQTSAPSAPFGQF